MPAVECVSEVSAPYRSPGHLPFRSPSSCWCTDFCPPPCVKFAYLHIQKHHRMLNLHICIFRNPASCWCTDFCPPPYVKFAYVVEVVSAQVLNSLPIPIGDDFCIVHTEHTVTVSLWLRSIPHPALVVGLNVPHLKMSMSKDSVSVPTCISYHAHWIIP